MMTPKQVAAIRQQLQDFVEEFADELGRSERRQWCGKIVDDIHAASLQQGFEQVVENILDVGSESFNSRRRKGGGREAA